MGERAGFELQGDEQMGFFPLLPCGLGFTSATCPRQRHPVGPGRGRRPAPWWLYALGITALDPGEHGLLFERFSTRGAQ